jgi:hypothetical protein
LSHILSRLARLGASKPLLQALLHGRDRSDLIIAGSELRAAVQQGLTLVNVYGSQSGLAKALSGALAKKATRAKFDEVQICQSGRRVPGAQ